MPINRLDRLEIDRLLLLREERLAAIGLLERRIEEILGQPYPDLPPPPDLPSLRKPTKQKKKTRPRSPQNPPTSAPPSIRPLIAEETAYQIRYRCEGEIREEVHTNEKMMKMVVENPGQHLVLLAIHTLNEENQLVETLYENTVADDFAPDSGETSETPSTPENPSTDDSSGD